MMMGNLITTLAGWVCLGRCAGLEDQILKISSAPQSWHAHATFNWLLENYRRRYYIQTNPFLRWMFNIQFKRICTELNHYAIDFITVFVWCVVILLFCKCTSCISCILSRCTRGTTFPLLLMHLRKPMVITSTGNDLEHGLLIARAFQI